MKFLKNTLYFLFLFAILALCVWHQSAKEAAYQRLPAQFVRPQPLYACTPSQETNAALKNPYCGYYHIYGFVLKDEETYQTPEDVPVYSNDPERLVQVQILLSRFQEKPITETALSQLDIILSAYAASGKQILLRFLYDWSGNGLQTEPKDIQILLTHMEQTAEVYNRYKDCILTLHGLSTGSYGEMWGTSYGSSESLKKLAEMQASVTDPLIYLSVRTPYQWRTITGADDLDALLEIDNSPFLGRLGLFNDGMLGSDSDLGTYIDRSRDEELSFQDLLCRTVPNGGEAVIDNPYNDLENAIADLSRMHVSYLSSVHHPAVIQKWKDSIYHSQDCYDGMSGFDYIGLHLGYRYVLQESALLDAKGSGHMLSIAIENVGFAPSYRPFAFTLTLLSEEDAAYYELPLSIQSSEVLSGVISRFLQPFDTDSYPAGNYRLYLNTLDETTGEVIRYANDLPLTEYGYELGNLYIPVKINHRWFR